MRWLFLIGCLMFLVAARPSSPAVETTFPTVATDTLRYEVTAGESLVISLPGGQDATYRGIRLPSLSWIVGESFGWRTLIGQEGREYILIQRSTPARTDTLVIVVDVE